ncbi:MAG: hypothetical protein NTZ10_02670 [Candidatus Saganbacteria bacterium]|nr:hypothetical protein [Candidatus Saganbacteria bacterium]
MKNKVLLIFTLMIMFAASALADHFSISYVPDGITVKTSAKDKSSGKALWQNTIQYQKVNYKGKNMFYTQEQGSGIYGPDKTYKSWVTRSYSFLQGNRLIPSEVQILMKDKNGKAVRKIEKYYNAQTERVICVVNSNTKTFNFKDGMLDKEMMSACLMNFPFGQKDSMQYYLLTPEPAVYNMTVYYRGKETLSKDGGQIECYKLEIVPDLGAINIFGAFIPKMYFWYETNAPHDFVRYEGLESGLGTPYIVIDREK